MLTDPCEDPGIFARVVQALLTENSSDNVFCLFCPQLLQFYSGLSMGFISKKTIILQVFGGGGGGPTYSRGRVGEAGRPNANS